MDIKRKIAGITALCMAFTAGAAVSPRLTRAASVFGDINGDSRVDAKDASIILSYYSYLSTTDGEPLSLEAFIGNGSEEPVTTTTTTATTTTTTTTTATTTTAATTTVATTTTTEATTTTTAPTVDSKYAYYEDLDAEFEENGLTFGNYNFNSGTLLTIKDGGNISSSSYSVYYHKGKLYFIHQTGYGYDLKISLAAYDISSGELNERPLQNFDRDILFSGGKFKYWAKNHETIVVGDVDDESFGGVIPVALSEKYAEKYAVLPSGALIERDLYSSSGNDDKCSYYSEETGEVLMPFPTLTDSHGLEQKADATYLAVYGNKVYYCHAGSGEKDPCYLYYLDLDKQEWVQKSVEYKISTGYGVGKYLFTSGDGYHIYNMETDEWVATVSRELQYYGGEHHIKMGNSDITEYKFPSDGGEPETKLYSDAYPSIGGKAYPVNGKYYLYIDKAGVFLRTYDNSEPEALVLQFNQ